MYKENMKLIVNSDDKTKQKKLNELMIDLMEEMKQLDCNKFMWYEYDIHKIMYGSHLGKELATCWVSMMQNKDGSSGEHWSYEQTTELRKDKKLDYDDSDFYAVMNMVYSDYFDTKFSTDTYLELAKDWIDDKDITNKLIKYYFFVVKD